MLLAMCISGVTVFVQHRPQTMTYYQLSHPGVWRCAGAHAMCSEDTGMPDALPDIAQSLFDEEDCLLSVDLPLSALARCEPWFTLEATPVKEERCDAFICLHSKHPWG